jgi:periplasmic protein CpxP/Spy
VRGTIKACSTTSTRKIMKTWIKPTWMKKAMVTMGAVLVVGGLSACAGGRHGGHMSETDSAARQAKMVEYAGKKLDLNDTQKQRLNVLGDKLREQRASLMGASKDPRADVQALVAGDKLDRAKAQTLIDEKTGAIKAKSPELIAAAADFFDSLNSNQQQQIRDLMNRKRGWKG